MRLGLRSRTNLRFSAMTWGRQNTPKSVIAHLLRDLYLVLLCFLSDYSGCRRSNVRLQLTGWGAALSLAALNDFVCVVNGTYVHLVEAMPQAALKSFADFLFLAGCSRITSSRALPFGNALHSTLTIRFASQIKRKK